MDIPYNRLYITIGTVSVDKKDKIDMLLKVLFPKFKKWVLFIMSQPDNSTFLEHNSYIRANFTNDEFVLKSKPAFGVN